MGIQTLVQGILYLSIPWIALELVAQFLERDTGRLAGYRWHYDGATIATVGGGGGGGVGGSRRRGIGSPSLLVKRLLSRYAALRQQATAASGTSGLAIGNGSTISRGRLALKLETTAYNHVPRACLRRLGILPHRTHGRRRSEARLATQHLEGARARHALRIVYTCGTIFAGFTLLASLCFLLWNALGLIVDIAQLQDRQESIDAGGIGAASSIKKRALEELPRLGKQQASRARTSRLVPLIPGLTLPWSHLAPLIFALCSTQIVHEAGHAICGALHGMQPLKMGVLLLFPAIPGAFVALPQGATQGRPDDEDADAEDPLGGRDADSGSDSDSEAELDGSFGERRALSDLTRLQIISAGVWHNALTAALLAFAASTGIGAMVHNFVWTDAGGVRVIYVDPASPLSMHLGPGALVTQIDDVDLSAQQAPNQRSLAWTQYVEGLLAPDTSRGWCVPNEAWQSQSPSCCKRLQKTAEPSAESDSTHLCFLARYSDVAGRCYSASLLVDSQAERCTGRCSADRVCIRPDARESLIRITARETDAQKAIPTVLTDNARGAGRRPGQGRDTRVILFQGDRAAVQHALQVSMWDFVAGFAAWPRQGFELTVLVWQYMLTLSVAMTLFNMLPLPGLDGDVYLEEARFALTRLGGRISANAPQQSQWKEGNDASSDLELRGASHDVDTPRDASQGGGQAGGGPHFAARPASKGTRDASRDTQNPASTRAGLRLITSLPSAALAPRSLGRIHARLRWLTIALAVFVFGGSTVLHAVGVGAEP